MYYYNNKSEEITRYFVDENHLILNPKNSEPNCSPSEYLQAITDCKLLVFSNQGWDEISETIIGWESILQKIITKNHREKILQRSDLVSKDATTRYL